MILGKKWEEATGTQCYSDREGVRTFGEFVDYIEFADIMDGKINPFNLVLLK